MHLTFEAREIEHGTSNHLLTSKHLEYKKRIRNALSCSSYFLQTDTYIYPLDPGFEDM